MIMILYYDYDNLKFYKRRNKIQFHHISISFNIIKQIYLWRA